MIEKYGLKRLNKNLYKKVRLMDVAKISIIEEARVSYEKQKRINLQIKQKNLIQKRFAENKTKFLYKQIIVPFAKRELSEDFIIKCFPERNIVECYSKEDGFLFALCCRPLNSTSWAVLDISTRNFLSEKFYVSSYTTMKAPKDGEKQIEEYMEKIRNVIVKYLKENYLKTKKITNDQYEILEGIQ